MTYCIRMKARHFTAALALAGMMLFVPGWAPAYGDSAQVYKLLQQARASAVQLKADSNEMETYSQNQLHWQTHARQINRVKEHVNNSGKILADLHAARDGAEPWQQDVIDKITPLLQEMASHTESIINHLNDRRQTWHPEYHGYLQSNSRLADDLSKLIADYIDYGQAKSKTDSLGKSLGFAQSQGASAE